MDSAWRTVVVNPHDSYSLRDGCMVIGDGDKEIRVPVGQIRELLIAGTRGDISLPLLMHLSEQGTLVVFCDEKYNPVCELNSEYRHHECAGRIMDQAAWTQRRKDAVWAKIVRLKLKNQASLLAKLGRKVPYQLTECVYGIEAGDPTNREGVGAKLYFEALFGEGFVRHKSDELNAALNYGYSILMSAVSRAIAANGYSTALGIHHVNRQNRFNLACDIMEPFRPFVDREVYLMERGELTPERKLLLIHLLQEDCVYGVERMNISDALLRFSKEVMDSMTNGNINLTEVRLG